MVRREHEHPVVQSFANVFVECVDRAFERYRNAIGAEHSALTGGARAFAVRDLIINELLLGPVRKGSLQFIDKSNTKLFVAGRCLVRVKKLDERLEVRYHPTVNSERYHLQLPLLGIPPMEHLYLGYLVDASGDRAVRILIVRPGPTIHERWHADLREAIAPQIELFGARPAAERRVDRVRIRAEHERAGEVEIKK